MADSFQNPVGPNKPTDPYENYRIEEIQKDKGEKESQKPASDRPLLAAFVVYVLKKIVGFFERSPQEKACAFTEGDLRGLLIRMKELLESLKMEDHSQDAVFLQELSGVWVLLHDTALEIPRKSHFAAQMRALIQSIRDYPEGREHSLGFYLSEYTGQKWMPFPYMEIIQGLWVDYQKNEDESQLERWCRDLDGMIADFAE